MSSANVKMSDRNLLQGTQRQHLLNSQLFQSLPIRIKTEGRVQRHETKMRFSRNLRASLLTASLVSSGRRNSNFLNNNNT
ncbi:hypothetical protein CEXT_416461 [Caerostris extrusa]|uniref:Uncharacterized protein n=1 Tax=Caerostris extrusa TaxID=172846 RepID=A0AAV4Y9M4_CAEEX|nr:hypothetical protein CEXT_416461 [Caerostris extrusa]